MKSFLIFLQSEAFQHLIELILTILCLTSWPNLLRVVRLNLEHLGIKSNTTAIVVSISIILAVTIPLAISAILGIKTVYYAVYHIDYCDRSESYDKAASQGIRGLDEFLNRCSQSKYATIATTARDKYVKLKYREENECIEKNASDCHAQTCVNDFVSMFPDEAVERDMLIRSAKENEPPECKKSPQPVRPPPSFKPAPPPSPDLTALPPPMTRLKTPPEAKLHSKPTIPKVPHVIIAPLKNFPSKESLRSHTPTDEPRLMLGAAEEKILQLYKEATAFAHSEKCGSANQREGEAGKILTEYGLKFNKVLNNTEQSILDEMERSAFDLRRCYAATSEGWTARCKQQARNLHFMDNGTEGYDPDSTLHIFLHKCEIDIVNSTDDSDFQSP